MNENVLRTSLSACVFWLAKQITCQLSYWVIFWKKSVRPFGSSSPFSIFLLPKNPKCFLWYQLNIRKIKRLEWPDFFLQGYQKQPDCVLVSFIDPKIMKLFVDVNQLFEVFNKQFIYCWFSIFFPKKYVILIKHVLLHVSLHYLSPINSNLIYFHF